MTNKEVDAGADGNGGSGMGGRGSGGSRGDGGEGKRALFVVGEGEDRAE